MKKAIDWSILLEKGLEWGGKFLNSLTPTGKVVVVTSASAAVAIATLPAACKSVQELTDNAPKMAENINQAFDILKQGPSNLLADVVDEAKIVDGEVAA